MKKIRFIFLISCILFFTNSLYSGEEIDKIIKEAEEFVQRGDYESAYKCMVKAYTLLSSEMDNLRGILEYYKSRVRELKSPVRVNYQEEEAANRLYLAACSWQHKGVFKKTGKEKIEALNKAIELYRKILIEYPYTGKVEEAQYRICRIYFRFLRDYENAEKELYKYLNLFPRGKHISDVKDMLRRIKTE